MSVHFKNIYIHLLHAKWKHSNIDVCASVHLEKLNFETVLEESCYKSYFGLLLFPSKM